VALPEWARHLGRTDIEGRHLTTQILIGLPIAVGLGWLVRWAWRRAPDSDAPQRQPCKVVEEETL
jgi:hypothetical protein